MTLQQLKYAIEVANRGSINEAAKSLYISQPSLSNAIRELEQEIGSNIFIRSNRGISVSIEGKEFLSYALQVVEQAELLEEHYLGVKVSKQKFGVSTQHYVFAIMAFARLMQKMNPEEFDFTFRETTVSEVIGDVKKRKSEVGILYMNQFNALTIQKKLEEAELEFRELFQSDSYVFVTSSHPLAKKEVIRLRDLKSYTYVSFGKGEYNSHYFVEEMLNILEHKRNIRGKRQKYIINMEELLIFHPATVKIPEKVYLFTERQKQGLSALRNHLPVNWPAMILMLTRWQLDGWSQSRYYPMTGGRMHCR